MGTVEPRCPNSQLVVLRQAGRREQEGRIIKGSQGTSGRTGGRGNQGGSAVWKKRMNSKAQSGSGLGSPGLDIVWAEVAGFGRLGHEQGDH